MEFDKRSRDLYQGGCCKARYMLVFAPMQIKVSMLPAKGVPTSWRLMQQSKVYGGALIRGQEAPVRFTTGQALSRRVLQGKVCAGVCTNAD